MNSPYMGRFEVTQIQHPEHDGLDLVGLDSKEIHATEYGKVIYAGWENEKNHAQGFGLYVCIYSPVQQAYLYYGHLSELRCSTGDTVKITDVIGIEGSTGYSTGSHCHYCARRQYAKGNSFDISKISGIPNKTGVYDDGYRPPSDNAQSPKKMLKIYLDDELIISRYL